MNQQDFIDSKQKALDQIIKCRTLKIKEEEFYKASREEERILTDTILKPTFDYLYNVIEEIKPAWTNMRELRTEWKILAASMCMVKTSFLLPSSFSSGIQGRVLTLSKKYGFKPYRLTGWSTWDPWQKIRSSRAYGAPMYKAFYYSELTEMKPTNEQLQIDLNHPAIMIQPDTIIHSGQTLVLSALNSHRKINQDKLYKLKKYSKDICDLLNKLYIIKFKDLTSEVIQTREELWTKIERIKSRSYFDYDYKDEKTCEIISFIFDESWRLIKEIQDWHKEYLAKLSEIREENQTFKILNELSNFEIGIK